MGSRQQGFSLVELMIAVVIVGILMGVALPMYKDQVAKSQLGAALAEVAPARAAYEIAAQDDAAFTPTTGSELGLGTSSQRCSAYTVGSGLIACTVQGNDIVDGAVLSLKRSTDGQWACEVAGEAVLERHLPGGCTVGEA